MMICVHNYSFFYYDNDPDSYPWSPAATFSRAEAEAAARNYETRVSVSFSWLEQYNIYLCSFRVDVNTQSQFDL